MKFAVCYNCAKEPSTWGEIENMDKSNAIIKYSKDAPVWFGFIWNLDYIKIFDTEKECREIVENHEKNKEYDSR